jgi:hypothetical protein
MNKTSFAVLSFLVFAASAASAQTFEQRVSEVNQVFAAQGAPKEYAKSIFCAQPPKDSGLPAGLRFYTRHDSKKAPKDETAAGLNDYRRAYFDAAEFHFDAWSCDTQDYWFTFNAQSLLKTTAGEKSKAVKGHVRVETRGQVDWEGDLDCTASF